MAARRGKLLLEKYYLLLLLRDVSDRYSDPETTTWTPIIRHRKTFGNIPCHYPSLCFVIRRYASSNSNFNVVEASYESNINGPVRW